MDDHDHCSFNEFVREWIVAQNGHTHAWRKNYVDSTHRCDAAIRVTNQTIDRWRSRDIVPKWAVDQITILRFHVRPPVPMQDWTGEEVQFLMDAYQASQGRYRDLASLCTEKFGRTISENAIKGKIDRLIKSGRLSNPRRRVNHIQRELAL